jgi:hypothetical protein
MFLVFSENGNHPILGLGKGQVIGIAESGQTRAGNLFSRDFLVDNEQQNANCLSFRALFPIFHIYSPHSGQRPSRTGVIADFVAHRCFTPSWFVVHWAIQ